MKQNDLPLKTTANADAFWAVEQVDILLSDSTFTDVSRDDLLDLKGTLLLAITEAL